MLSLISLAALIVATAVAARSVPWIVDAFVRRTVMGFAGLTMALVLIALSLIVWVTFLIAPWVSRRLGKIGSSIVTRMMGLLLAAIAVEFIAGGLRGLFPALG